MCCFYFYMAEYQYWRGSQVVRQGFAKPLYAGSIPAHASKSTFNVKMGYGTLAMNGMKSIAAKLTLVNSMFFIPFASCFVH